MRGLFFYRNKERSTVAFAMLLAMPVAYVPAYTTISSAAVKPALSAKKGTILTGESETVTITNIKKKKIKKLTVASSNKKVATAVKSGKNSFTIKTKKAGKAIISVKLSLKNKKKYKLNYKATVADIVNKDVAVIKTDGNDYKLRLRFYAGAPHVPYVRLTTFYKRASVDNEMTVKKTGKNEYLLTNPDGDTATVNTDTDVLNSDRFEDFCIFRIPSEGEREGISTYEGTAFLKPLDAVVIAEPKPYTVSFAQYGIDLIGEGNDIWLPLETASDLFYSVESSFMCYAGDKVYHIGDYYSIEKVLELNISDGYLSSYPDGKRPKDIVDYTYRELMFMLDTLWQSTGRCYFSDAIEEKGMDRALSETDDTTRGLQKLLKSEDLKEYQLAMGILSDMLFDGGHTNLYWLIKRVDDLNKTESDYFDKVSAMAEKIGYKVKNLPSLRVYYMDVISAQRGWKDLEYHEYGDTAVFTLDSFDTDPKGWSEYYKNGGEYPNDTYGAFMRSLNRAAENKSIKNFVLDLTCNLGGDDVVVSAMMGIMADDPNIYAMSRKTGWNYSYPFKIDKNLDGVFDEKDDAVSYPFRFAVLTSRVSFSCGNMLSCYAKSHGIMTLGERSGGGACAIVVAPFGDGMVGIVSIPNEAVTKDGEGIDTGFDPDRPIEIKKDAEGNEDFSAFFDIPSLSKYINEFYDGVS